MLQRRKGNFQIGNFSLTPPLGGIQQNDKLDSMNILTFHNELNS